MRRRKRPIEVVLDMLTRQGITAQDLRISRGYWSHRQQDCCRWETVDARTTLGVPVTVCSYDTAKKCARYGITLSPTRQHLDFEASALEKSDD